MRSGEPPTPESMLLHQIADGALDSHLQALAEAIHARRHLLHTVATQTALAQLCVGDEVQIDNTVRPQYLRGLRGNASRSTTSVSRSACTGPWDASRVVRSAARR